jgi:RNA polymerase sigma factor (sigma-70 family)
MQEAIRHGSRAAQARPTHAELEPAARTLVERHSGQLIATARRYSLTAEDAEDAYQRGLEIMLTRAPSLREHELVPWLKTVVKHEAFTIRKQRQRAELAGSVEPSGGYVPPTHEQAERMERLRLGVEAMSRLKPQEIRCLLLRAEGYSYKQICDETGWTYTKVNRSITEGRKAFLTRVAGIESGAECERMQPLLSRLADGEATAEDMAAMRPHLRSCLACRATLREFRAAPARAAAFAPLLVTPGVLHRVLKSLGLQKTAAAVALIASVGGGGVAVVHGIDHSHTPPPAHHRTHPKPQPKAHPRPKAHIAHAHRVRRKHHHTKPLTSVVSVPAPPPPTSSPPPATPPPATPTSGEFGP